jgi:starch-binding outer membrane protein, SusD/RagB family
MFINMIKVLKFSSVAALVLLGSASCTDLKVKEIDSVVQSSDGVFRPIDPTSGLLGAYKDLSAYTDQANIYALGSHTSGEMIPPTRGTDWGDNGVWRSLDQHTWNSTHGQVTDAWYQLNQRVSKATIVLASNPSPAQAAEAKFIRAFNMSHLVDMYGQAIFRKATDAALDNAEVLDRVQAWTQVVKDLNEALAVLPEAGPDATRYTATKAAAQCLLARMILNKAVYTTAGSGPYTFAAADMDAVISNVDAMKGYSLDNSYFNNFTAGANKESILMCHPDGNPQNRWRMTLHYDQEPDGWNGFTTLADFYGKFEAKDQRIGIPAKKDGSDFSGIGKGFLRGQQFTKAGVAIIEQRGKTPLIFTDDVPLSGAGVKQGIRLIKYHPADAKQYNFMRYAEAYLMKVEALLRKGDAAGALTAVNVLRVSRGATPLTALTADVLLDERRRELYWEGYGRTDEIRFGKFTSGAGVVNKEGYTTLFPIPAAALASNPNLKQNPGY